MNVIELTQRHGFPHDELQQNITNLIKTSGFMKTKCKLLIGNVIPLFSFVNWVSVYFSMRKFFKEKVYFLGCTISEVA